MKATDQTHVCNACYQDIAPKQPKIWSNAMIWRFGYKRANYATKINIWLHPKCAKNIELP
jgi:hypothetical protein